MCKMCAKMCREAIWTNRSPVLRQRSRHTERPPTTLHGVAGPAAHPRWACCMMAWCIEGSFSLLVSSQKPFGLRTFIKGAKGKTQIKNIKVYQNGGFGYISDSEIERNKDWVDKYKVIVSRAYNAGDNYPHQIIGKPIISEPGSCCTETYVSIGPFRSKKEAQNVCSYICTKFFRFMVSAIKVSQMAPAAVYEFVPVQDFTKPWTDEELYAKYGLTDEEINFIESMIKPMELDGESNE